MRRDWTVAKHKLQMPSGSASGTITVLNLNDEIANENLRLRVSRDLGTKRIDYEVHWEVLP